MKWQEVCEHASLKNLPFKIELNRDGKILMTPVKVSYSGFQGELAFLLRSLERFRFNCKQGSRGEARGVYM